jgi:hypothetical protein
VLHNFGGNVGMWGDVSSLNSGPFDAFANASSVAGVGMFPEGIDQNSPYYSFLFDVAWCGARATNHTHTKGNTWLSISLSTQSTSAFPFVVRAWLVKFDQIRSESTMIVVTHQKHIDNSKGSLLCFAFLCRETEPFELKRWWSDFALQRYGRYDERAEAAWALLAETVYGTTQEQKSMYLLRSMLV